jgi:general secretion pathway protein M
MKDFWERLTNKQQMIFLAGGSIALVFILIQWVILPIVENHDRTKSALTANQRILKQMVPMTAEYGNLKQDAAQIEGILAARPRDFNLFSYVEKKTGEAAIKPQVKSINPSKTTASGPYEETAVDIKLELVTLKQLLNFIYLIESPMDLVKIKSFSITKNKEKGEYLNATLQIVSYVAVKG